MTHSLNGKTFFQWQNSFVTALVSQQVLLDIERRNAIIEYEMAARRGASPERAVRENIEAQLAHFPLGPIFTFARFAKVKECPFLTGSMTLLYRLQNFIQTNGGGVSAGHPFHVPFSNGPLNLDYRFVTTHRQFEDTFGTTQEQLLRGVNVHNQE